MPLLGVALAHVVDPIFPVAALAAIVALYWACAAGLRRRVARALGWLLVSSGCGVVAWLTTPLVSEAHEGEAMAVGDCRSIAVAQAGYAAANGGAYGTLSCLAAPASCGWSVGTPAFLDEQLASLRPRRDYQRSFVAGARGAGKPDAGLLTFVYAAVPLDRGRGARGFAIDHTGRLCFTTDGSIPPLTNGALSPSCTALK